MNEQEFLSALSQVDQKHIKLARPFLRAEPNWRYFVKKSMSVTMKIIGAAAAAVIVLGLIFLPGLWQDNTPIQAASPTEEEPLRICIDLCNPVIDPNPANQAIQQFRAQLKKIGLEHVKIESIPRGGERRELMITRLRTEIMAGDGPDVLILSNYAWADGEIKSLVPYPEKAMADGKFLDLTGYLERPSYMKPEELTETVLKGGQYDGKQMILPLTYRFQSAVFLQKDVAPPEAMTWDECIKSGDPAHRYAAGYSNFITGSMQGYLSQVMGKAVDCESGTLNFSKEEMEQVITAVIEAKEKNDQPERAARGTMGLQYGVSMEWDCQALFPDSDWEEKWLKTSKGQLSKTGLFGNNPDPHTEFESDEGITYFPLYNRQGGVTAEINYWAAVSATTEYPDDAFLVLDFLLSREEQMKKGRPEQSLYGFMLGTTTFPILNDAGSPENPISKWYLNEKSFAAIDQVKRQINAVTFHTPIDKKLQSLLMNCLFAYEDSQENGKNWREEIKQPIDSIYEEMELLAAES